MSAKKSYNRFFIIFQEEDKGFGIAIDKQPTGYTKIETRNGRCKITVYVQNLSRDKGPYVCRLLDASTDNVLIATLGEIKLDETGRGDTWWEYKEEDIANTGRSIEKFNVAAIMVDGEKLQAPLAGYTSKEKQPWREKLLEASRQKEDESRKDEETRHDDNEMELEEEAKKFKEYEEMLKKDLEEIHKKEEEKEGQEYRKGKGDKKDKDKCEDEHDKWIKDHDKHDDKYDDKHDDKHDDKYDDKCDDKHDDKYDDKCDDKHEEKHEDKYKEDKKEKLDIKDMESNCQWTSNMDTYLKDNKDKPHDNADAFHEILKDYEEDKDLEEEFNNTRWWKIPYNEYETYKGKVSYEHYCAVHHLKMAYPYMNYIKYFKKCGYSYFGIKYDKDGEVKYLMYGIEGNKTPQDQPYMGMTGFVKWIKPAKKDKGIWIMYFNPYNGCIMIPKEKNRY